MAYVVLMASDRSLVAALAREFPAAGHDATVLETSMPRKVLSLLKDADVILAAAGRNGDAADLYGELRSLPELGEIPVLLGLDEAELSSIEWRTRMDDFILLPGSPGEASARVQRMLAQKEVTQASSHLVRAGDVTVDPRRFDVRVRGVPVALTLQEFRLLDTLIRGSGQVLTRTELLEKAWHGSARFEGSRTVDVHIRRLRSKLEASATTRIITVSGVGYRLEVNTDLTNP